MVFAWKCYTNSANSLSTCVVTQALSYFQQICLFHNNYSCFANSKRSTIKTNWVFWVHYQVNRKLAWWQPFPTTIQFFYSQLVRMRWHKYLNRMSAFYGIKFVIVLIKFGPELNHTPHRQEVSQNKFSRSNWKCWKLNMSIVFISDIVNLILRLITSLLYMSKQSAEIENSPSYSIDLPNPALIPTIPTTIE